MKAMVIGVFGGPEVLLRQEVPERPPRNHEVLVRVHATSVNAVDCSSRRGERAVPLPAILGCDVSGVVESIGGEVEDFIPGDEVFYVPEIDSGSGSYAEYHVAQAGIVARKPSDLSHVEAAGVPLAAGTAWEGLVRRAALQPGETLLVHGSCPVALFAIQIASAAGAQIFMTTTAGTIAAEKRVGRARVIDRATEDFVRVIRNESTDGAVDVVFDTSGDTPLAQSTRVLKAYGRMVSTTRPPGEVPEELILRNITHYFVHAEPGRGRLDMLRALLHRKQLMPIIDSIYPVWEVAAAHRLFESGTPNGKVILQVVADDGPGTSTPLIVQQKRRTLDSAALHLALSPLIMS
ncbi:MAG: zinc-binding dehydrogenase [Gemmatimonadales bacterium]|nr:zinc-binding dehydrogenase [Gemmatimonadales bacterium]